MHTKRQEIPREWPIPRKGTPYIAVATHSKTKGIALLFALRDMLKIARTRKEAKYMTMNGDVKINCRTRTDEMFPLQVFDILTLEKISKNYRLEIVNRKFALQEIPAKEAGEKVVKITGKKTLKSGGVQMNLQDGTNYVSKDKFSVGDSTVLNLKENKVQKILPLKVGAKVRIILGSHSGESGEIKEIIKLTRSKEYILQIKKQQVRLPQKTLLVVE